MLIATYLKNYILNKNIVYLEETTKGHDQNMRLYEWIYEGWKYDVDQNIRCLPRKKGFETVQ